LKPVKLTFFIDPAIHLNFKVACAARRRTMTEELEALKTKYARQSHRNQEGKETP
jgi:hypothetical protein